MGSGEQVNFAQPSSSSIALNRVHDAQVGIDGQLNANGQVWIINPNGVLLAATGAGERGRAGGNHRRHQQQQLHGRELQVQPARQFQRHDQQRRYHHDGGCRAGGVCGAECQQSGLIRAKLGKVQLGSGDSFTLDLYGDGLINLQASPAVTQQIVTNSGTIQANGGQVPLTAAAAQNTVNSLINMSGVIEAQSIGTQNGQIVLYAEGSNAVQNNVAANKDAERRQHGAGVGHARRLRLWHRPDGRQDQRAGR